MPAKRMPLNRAALPRLNDEMVNLYLQLRAAKLVEIDDPAERGRWIAAFHRLHELCGLRPWHSGPADIGDEPEDYETADPARLARWRETHRWKLALDAAVQERG